MQAITYSEARNNLATHLDRVVMDSDITIITRQKSEPAVLMSLKDYENLMETLHLLRGKNGKRLLVAIEDIKQGRNLEEHSLIDE
jgi:antitoxin YefM